MSSWIFLSKKYQLQSFRIFRLNSFTNIHRSEMDLNCINRSTSDSHRLKLVAVLSVMLKNL